MLNLNNEQVKKLEEFIQELPTKFGLPLLNLLRSFGAENEQNAKENSKVPSIAPKIPVEAE